jgi:hypothetical protein
LVRAQVGDGGGEVDLREVGAWFVQLQ